MGISLQHADFIVREHKFRPLPRTVHLLGRQTVLFGYQEALALLERHQVRPAETKVDLDRSTLGAITARRDFITDTTFFNLLGVSEVKAIDHSSYEGADIILDLNQPLPAPMEGTVDFLFGGSVLDNIFDPATYIKNLARLLRPHGRLIDQNIASFTYHPYLVVAPAWFFDYFVLNRFADCKLYFLNAGPSYQIYGLDPDVNDDLITDFGNSPAGQSFGMLVVAEKGDHSSWNLIPSQDQYRSPEQWSVIRSNLREIQKSDRPLWRFAKPSPLDLLKVPLRRTKSFKYLGVFSALPHDSLPDDASGRTFSEPPERGIQIIEASYGLNVANETFRRCGGIPIYRGNVTEKVAACFTGCNGASLPIDVTYLEDPAPELGKDLRVTYYYAEDPHLSVRKAYVPAEAHGKTLVIPPLNG
jgi:hypothetical protein